jgi:hypothetical protein
MKTLSRNLPSVRFHFAVLCTAFALAFGGIALADKSAGDAKPGVPILRPSAHFDEGNGTLTIVAPAEAEMRCAQDARGFLVLSGEAWERSGDPSSENFEPVLRGVSAAKLRRVKMENGSRLIVGNLATDGELAIETRRLTLRGTLRAPVLRLRLSEQIVVEASARLYAQAGGNGGDIVCEAPVVITGGTFDVSGERGGTIRFSAKNMLQYGSLHANGSRDAGSIAIAFTGRYSETEGSRIFARSVNGRGGSIRYTGGEDATLYHSGTIEATGTEGGTVHVLGHGLKLAAAHIDVSGLHGGGTVLVGGDKQGANPGIRNAGSVSVNSSVEITADARVRGSGGKIIVWSDGRTEAAGKYSARGGAEGGDGGFIEASGKGELAYGAKADAGASHGKAGTLLLDPKFIEIKTGGGGSSIAFTAELVNPHPTAADSNFGVRVFPLATGNIVVISPRDDTNGVNTGAIHLYNGATRALISSLFGTGPDDCLGGYDQGGSLGISDIVHLGANAYVISQNAIKVAATYKGAFTYVNGTTGVSGTLSASNSILGVSTHMQGESGEFPAITSGVQNYALKLSNGNYVLHVYGYNSGKGFAMLLDGATGLPPGAAALATPTAANSLFGTANQQACGVSVTDLKNGHYILTSGSNPSGTQSAGAATFCSSTVNTVGSVTAANSIVGSGAIDGVPGEVKVLPNGNFLCVMPGYGGGIAGLPEGAVILCSGTTGRPVVGNQSGVIDNTNSYLGINGSPTGSDNVGSGGVFILSSGYYVICSPNFGFAKGAIAVGDFVTGVVGNPTAANSLLGTTASPANGFPGDNIGLGANGGPGVVPVGDGNFVVVSPNFNGFRGAVTWMDPSAPLLGAVISSANSLVGSTGVAPGTLDNSLVGDRVGLDGVFTSQQTSYFNGSGTTFFSYSIADGNYVVLTSTWGGGGGGGSYNGKGAATFGNGNTGVKGTITSGNSLIGATAGAGTGDGVGSGIVILSNGNYVIRSKNFNVGRGAVTWCNGTSGLTGVVDFSNSLVGDNTGQSVADGNNQIIALTNGNYIIGMKNFQVGANMGAGAIIWGRGTTAGSRTTGPTLAANKITGVTQFDQVPGLLQALPNGHCVAVTPNFNSGGVSSAGAVTWLDGASGRDVTGGFNPVSATNSLVGGSMNDQVGSGSTVLLPNGNFVVQSANWDGGFTDAGAVTFCKGDGTTVGVVGSGNSLVGSHNNDKIGQGNLVIVLPGSNYVLGNNSWNSGAGAVTWGSGTTGVKGVVSASNSIIGGPVDQLGTFQVATSGSGIPFTDNPRILSSGDFILLSNNFHSGGNVVGAATFVYGATGQTLNASNAITAANSMIGSATGQNTLGSAEDVVNGNVLVSFHADGPGRVRLFTGVGQPSSLLYSDQATGTVSIAPSTITDALGNGTNVKLQANTDLTVTDHITVSGGSAALTLQAGRSILINANITTNNGPLTLTANDVLAAGVVDVNRDAGPGVLTMAAATILNTGTGVLTAQVLDGAGKTNTTSGPMTLETVKANGGLLKNDGNTAGSNISVTSLQTTANMTATVQAGAPTVTVKTLDVAKNMLTVNGNFAFAPIGQFITQIAGTAAGTLGQVSATGTVNLNDAALNATAVGYNPPNASVHKIIDKISAGAITGTFNGLAEDSSTTISAKNFTVKYTGDTGNDGVLVRTIVGTVVVGGDLVISEFRARGPAGVNDEFIEIYNRTNHDITIVATDASGGYAVAASDGVARFVIPDGTLIPSHGHFLGANSVAYSLGNYPSGNGTVTAPDATWTTDIPGNVGIALFNTATAANFVLANRLDAVGSTSEANTLYKEGTGYPAINATFSIDHAFVRKQTASNAVSDQLVTLADGVPADTDNNAADFTFVDTNGTSAGAGQRLGAPGPENTASPISDWPKAPNLGYALLDPTVSPDAVPNRVRDLVSVPAQNSTFGTLDVRRTFTNNTAAPLTTLRFRIVKLTTFPAPSGFADLRPRSSGVLNNVVTAGGNVNVQGTLLEQPPSQPNGGGFNSTMEASTITVGTPLAPGASIPVHFLFGIQQTGNICFAIVPETLPATSQFWFVTGSTDGTDVTSEDFGGNLKPVVSYSNADLAANAPTLVINGARFSATPANNTVVFNDGAVGAVTAATATSLTVTFSTKPVNAGPLTATVTTNAVSSGYPVQVATVIPVVTLNTASMLNTAPTITINGFGFGNLNSVNTVVFNLGATGSVTTSSPTSLIVTFNNQPSLGNLTAVVTSNFISSGAPVQVATVTDNNPPVAGPVAVERYPTQSIKINLTTILAQASDPDPGNTIKVVSIKVPTGPTHGTATLSSSNGTTGFVLYAPTGLGTPGVDQNADQFSYTVEDNHGAQATNKIFIGIKVDNAPSTNITSLTAQPDGSVAIDFSGVPNRTYGLQFKVALADPQWTNIGPTTTNQFGVGHYVDGPPPHAAASGFYRLVYPPQ